MQIDNIPNKCILHAGMRKTGTTVIQKFLLNGLADPAFRFFCFGNPNGNASEGLVNAFSDLSERPSFNVRKARGREEILRGRPDLLNQFEAALTAASEHRQTLVVSGETLWGHHLHRPVRDFLESRGWSVDIIGYVRPTKSWLESGFQQRLRIGYGKYWNTLRNDGLSLPRLNGYRKPIESLDATFGRDRVGIHAYDPQRFEAGCVVRDFVRRLGIQGELHMGPRANQSLRLPAVRLLYAYRRFGPKPSSGQAEAVADGHRIRALMGLAGDPLRFHSDLVRPAYRLVEEELTWLNNRLGFSLQENIFRDDDGPCIRLEADLFDFDAETLDWLARKTGKKTLRPAKGEAIARAVAEQVHHLSREIPSTQAGFLGYLRGLVRKRPA